MLEVVSIRLSISNAFIVRGRRPILVDSGSPGEARRLVRAMKRCGVDASDLALVLHTHGHADHCGNTAELLRQCNAPAAIHAADADMLRSGRIQPLCAVRPAHWLMRPLIRFRFAPVENPTVIDEGAPLDAFGVDARVISTPGHTRGSISLVLDGGDVIAGDVLRGGLLGGLIAPGSPQYPYFADDLAVVRQSVRSILALEPRRVYVGHGGPLEPDAIARWLERAECAARNDK